MAQIPVFRIHNQRIENDRFGAIAEHLQMRGKLIETEEALFMQDKQRALAYALPGSRFAGLLFFTNQSESIARPLDRADGIDEVEAWTDDFIKHFRLGPLESKDERIRVSLAIKARRTESAIEEGKEGERITRVPVKLDVVSDLRVNDYHVTGPRAKVRLVFKNAQAPISMHHAQWEKLEMFEERPMLDEDEARSKVADRLLARGKPAFKWQLVSMRLAYFAGEFKGGPDLLLPYYFAEVEFVNPKDELGRQGPRQLIQVPACNR